MDECTHEVRAQYWRQVIQACQQRPAGQSAKSWMNENGICEQRYYSWQRKFRQEAYIQLAKDTPSVPVVKEKTDVSFAEVTWHQEGSAKEDDSLILNHCVPSAILKTGSLTIAITNDISEGLLSRIIQEVTHA